MGFNTSRRGFLGVATAGLAAAALAGCSSNNTSSGSSASAAAFDANKSYTLNVWAWEPTIQKDSEVTKAFTKQYPNITLNITNTGGASDEYTSLSNALQAGTGLPDVAQIEYYALPQYSIGSNLADLTPFGAGDLQSKYTTGTWNSIHQTTNKGAKGIFALPVDSGPMALFYNKATFDRAGVTTPPKTWDEFYDAAVKIHALGGNYYITSDSGNDAGFLTSIMWQLSPGAFKVDGQKVTVDFTGADFQKFVTIWQKLISEKLISTSITGWSDEWFKGLGDGTLASLPTGAWMPANLLKSSPAASGNFRVAAMPSIDGSAKNAENGGSSLAVLAKTAADTQAAAYKYLEFVSNGPGATLRVQAGNFPSLEATLEDPNFQASTGDFAAPDLLKYFGNQEYNKQLAAGAKNVNSGWSYLPFQVAVNSKFADTVGKAYNNSGTTLKDALSAWGDAIVSYGNDQGYQVTKKS
ncbi:multiple sugar transport system substrate-binding protein [Propionibacterium cyclohexanicum]|uniref:Multiple sugar transport system substrate-binding protein n=1 Tax=Propionibacterium cyclohexanicum TaxID=64702 RepID=A0A1H9TU75_9ACTN|nr:extracellular solute-binding protein [Propionibacterium cyclohexanicum]SES00676.1 multiple sugar transport system substrate-binding protein [Propionibacterium cyclohexanicum]